MYQLLEEYQKLLHNFHNILLASNWNLYRLWVRGLEDFKLQILFTLLAIAITV